MIGKDKYQHFAGCAAIAFFVGLLAQPWWGIAPAWWGFIASMGVGIAKEVYDWVSGKGTPSWADLAADLVGASLGALLV